jgi:serine/threonine-protein kinase RsbW
VSGGAGVMAPAGAPPGAGPAFQHVLRMSALDLAPLPSAVSSARLHARYVVAEWGFAAIARDCELIVSELVTNSVRHAAEVPGRPPVRLRLSGRARGLQIEVWDASDDLPGRGRDAPPDEPGGWGLVLVDALADRWGAYRTEGGGKVVFAVIGR